MAKENYDEVIDQKLSELYDVLKTLNSLKEKTVAVQQVVVALSAAGENRVAEIETAVGRFSNVLNKGVNNAASRLAVAVDQVGKSVAAAGKERTDNMKITAETVAASLEKLVQTSNEGTAKMSKVVAELKGLPLVEELRAIKDDNGKQAVVLQTLVESVGASADNNRLALKALTGKMEQECGNLAASIAESQKKSCAEFAASVKRIEALGESLDGVNANLTKKVEGVKSDLGEQCKSLKTVLGKSTDKINDDLGDLKKKSADQYEVLRNQVGDAVDNIKAIEDLLEEESRSLQAAEEKTIKAITALKNQLEDETGELKTAMENAAQRMRKTIVVSTVVLASLLILTAAAVAPVAINAWQAFLK